MECSFCLCRLESEAALNLHWYQLHPEWCMNCTPSHPISRSCDLSQASTFYDFLDSQKQEAAMEEVNIPTPFDMLSLSPPHTPPHDHSTHDTVFLPLPPTYPLLHLWEQREWRFTTMRKIQPNVLVSEIR
jgi:hypothetical protein